MDSEGFQIWKFLKTVGLAVLILAATAAGSALRLWVWLDSAKPLAEIARHSDITVSRDQAAEAGGDTVVAKPTMGMVRVLFVGLDDLDNVSRSDSIGLATFDEENRSVRVLSIPRDSRVRIPGHGTQKINHAYVYGGIDLLKRTISDFLNVNIDYYIILGFKTFPRIIDLMGGVDVDVDKRLVYRDRSQNLNINIQKGYQHMNGKTALEYVRFRHDPLGDIGRVQRQQKFISVVLNRLKSPTMWHKIPSLVSEALSGINTDLTPDALLSLALFANEIPSNRIELFMAPGRDATIEGLSYWLVDLPAVSGWMAKKEPRPDPAELASFDAPPFPEPRE